MKKGDEFLLGLDEPPAVQPKDGGWAQIRTPEKTYAVSPVLSADTHWGAFVHVTALSDGPDPVANQDRLVYRDAEGNGESRGIASVRKLN